MNILFFIGISLYMKIIPYYYSNYLKIKDTNIKQITGVYSIFNYNQNQDIYRYGSKKRRAYKRDTFLKGTIEDHHIIPRRYKKHQIIEETGFDLNCSNNILFMPSLCSFHMLKNPYILYHQTHVSYNTYIEEQLNSFKQLETIENKKYNLWIFLKFLEYSILNNSDELPWM